MYKISSIQHLRAFAVLAVLTAHFRLPYVSKFCGAIGVDVFFIISGYIIAQSITKLDPSDRPVTTFLIKRICRIVPMYYLLTIAYFVLYRNETKTDLIQSLLFLNFPIGDLEKYQDPVLMVGWTLNFEMIFYLIAIICYKFSKTAFIKNTLVLLGGIAIVGLIHNFKNILLDSLFSPFYGEFALGIFFFLIVSKAEQIVKIKYATEILFAFSFLVILIAMIGHDFGSKVIGIPREMIVWRSHSCQRFFIWGVPSFFFVISYYLLQKKYEFSSKLLSDVGEYSFSVYLIQVFFMKFGEAELWNTSPTGYVFKNILLMILTLMTSKFFFKYIEVEFAKISSYILKKPNVKHPDAT